MFEKHTVPQEKSEKEAFIAKLSKIIGVTLRSYITSLDKDEIKRFVISRASNNITMKFKHVVTSHQPRNIKLVTMKKQQLSRIIY